MPYIASLIDLDVSEVLSISSLFTVLPPVASIVTRKDHFLLVQATMESQVSDDTVNLQFDLSHSQVHAHRNHCWSDISCTMLHLGLTLSTLSPAFPLPSPQVRHRSLRHICLQYCGEPKSNCIAAGQCLMHCVSLLLLLVLKALLFLLLSLHLLLSWGNQKCCRATIPPKVSVIDEI